MNVYTADYLKKHEVFEQQFKDRQEALRTAKHLRERGFAVKVTKICPFGEYAWVVEGEKTNRNI